MELEVLVNSINNNILYMNSFLEMFTKSKIKKKMPMLLEKQEIKKYFSFFHITLG